MRFGFIWVEMHYMLKLYHKYRENNINDYRLECRIFIDILGVAALALKRPVNLVFTGEETFVA
jgi:hypothetical protein